MILVNEKVEHIKFGVGIITDEKDNKIWVQFPEETGNKIFLYPDAFEKFLKASNPTVENDVLGELQRKQEQLEQERLEREHEAAELEEKRAKLAPVKKKPVSRTTKKKA
jgi:hypothetical protein